MMLKLPAGHPAGFTVFSKIEVLFSAVIVQKINFFTELNPVWVTENA